MSSNLIGYFGFGSLVNRHTLRTTFTGMVPAKLKGYRRHWQAQSATLKDPVALLSIHEHAETDILGMIVIDDKANLPAVDAREAGYTRHMLLKDKLEILGEIKSDNSGVDMPDELYVYIADETKDVPDTGALLQSYLDAVMQGFRNEFGDDGVRHFVETTDGFERGLIADRSAPKYPRSVALMKEEETLYDALIAGARRDVN